MVSLLDIIGPVMVGPSSSHTAGACRLGLLGRGLMSGTPQSALMELHGSFARTGEGHGTDKALVAGLRYWDRVIAVGVSAATAEFGLPESLRAA